MAATLEVRAPDAEGARMVFGEEGPVQAMGAAGVSEIETLVRQLLPVLGRITGLESTYLTVIDWDGDVQEILFALNTGDLNIPEGLEVSWGDTLCRRALEGGPAFTSDVLAVYPDSAAARQLGITTYVTVPVEAPDGSVSGTLCGASTRGVEVSEDARLVMAALAQLVSLQLAHVEALQELERRAAALVETNVLLEQMALTDVLTGVGNRRALEQDLNRACSDARRRGEPVSVLTLDVDHFKAINDTFGHAAGDEVLRAVADQLRANARSGDTVARLGGDELVIVLAGADGASARRVAHRICWALADGPIPTSGGAVTATVSIGVATGDGCDPANLLQQADLALYEAKRAGRNRVGIDVSLDVPVP